MTHRPPNVLVLMSDQHRAGSTGCYGDAHVPTPWIDSLAESGTLFQNAFCASPLCGPSRASFVTATHPHTHGLVTHSNNRHRSGEQYRPQRTPGIFSLVHQLRENGYQTHASGYTGVHLFDGDRYLERDSDYLGYETFGASARDYQQQVGADVANAYNLGRIKGEMWEPSYFNVEGEPWPYDEHQMYDHHIAADAQRFLRERDPERPFFLYVGFRAPHPPWRAPAPFHEQVDPQNLGPLPDWTSPPPRGKPRRVIERHHYFDIPFYSEAMVRRSIAAYNAFVSYMDDCIGRILRQLDEAGLRDDTLIVYTSDHGDNLYRHGLCEKHTFYEDAIRIPLIFTLPGRIPAGYRTEALASNIDIMPTILTLLGVDVPEFAEGCDLRPVFEGEPVRRHVFAEYYHSLDPCRVVRGQRYKYIHTEEDVCELYDLHHDPSERYNLAWHPEYAELVREMDALAMEGWEIPEVPTHAAWNDLHERKQAQRLKGLDIVDPRPAPPDWANAGPARD